jgi:dTMP kinase
MDPKVGFVRIGRRRRDRFERQALAFHRRVRRGYLEIQKAEPKRVRIVRAARPPEVVQRDVRGIVDEFFTSWGAPTWPPTPPRRSAAPRRSRGAPRSRS